MASLGAMIADSVEPVSHAQPIGLIPAIALGMCGWGLLIVLCVLVGLALQPPP